MSLVVIVVVIHFLFVLFACFGGVLALRYRWMPWVHLPAAAWGALVELAGWYCPLTPLENWLRARSGFEPYPGDFIEQYLVVLLYPQGLTRGLQVLLALALIAINVTIYIWVYRRWRLNSKTR